jgi:hypothetical protein
VFDPTQCSRSHPPSETNLGNEVADSPMNKNIKSSAYLNTSPFPNFKEIEVCDGSPFFKMKEIEVSQKIPQSA